MTSEAGWSVRWARAAKVRPGSRDALTAHLREVLGPGEVVVGRLCPVCGSDAHGRPFARLDGRPVAVSLSRCGPHLVTALRTDAGPAIGVDGEQVEEVARRIRYADLVHPDDEPPLQAVPVAERTAYLWVAKEAILKAEGVGLTRPMTTVRLRDFELRRLEAPVGLLAVVCLGRGQGNGGSARP